MKTYTLTGLILIVIGTIALAYQGFTYTNMDKVVDIRPIQVTADKTKTLPFPPIVGGIALVGGIGLLVLAIKRADQRHNISTTGNLLRRTNKKHSNISFMRSWSSETSSRSAQDHG